MGLRLRNAMLMACSNEPQMRGSEPDSAYLYMQDATEGPPPPWRIASIRCRDADLARAARDPGP